MLTNGSARSQKQQVSFCYNSVAQGWARAGHANDAARWLNSATENCIEVQSQSYNMVIAAFVKVGELNKSEEWLSRMTAAGFAPSRGNGHDAIAAAWAQRGEKGRAAAVRKMSGEVAPRQSPPGRPYGKQRMVAQQPTSNGSWRER